MKKILVITSCVFGAITSSWAGTLGDINGDGTVALPEAVHALQVTSGLRPQAQSAAPPVDFRKYFYAANGDYEYLTSYDLANVEPYITLPPEVIPASLVSSSIGYHMGSETVNGVAFLVRQNRLTPASKQYYTVGAAGVAYAGNATGNTTGAAISWNHPPVMLGTSGMTQGTIIPNHYWTIPQPFDSGTPSSSYDEATFLGLEDVSVPAGTFANCLKMLKKVTASSGSTSSISINYYAENVGMVKSVSLQGTKMELHFAKIGSVTYPQGVTRYGGTFSLSSGSASGSGTVIFMAGATSGGVVLTPQAGGQAGPPFLYFRVVSANGRTFTADQTFYGGSVPQITLTVEPTPCTVAGSINTVASTTYPEATSITINGSCL